MANDKADPMNLSTKGGLIPAPESESEPDFLPLSTPDSGTGSFPLEPLEPIPRVESAPQVDLRHNWS